MQDVALPLLTTYAAVFVQRWDQYAVQQRDGSYWRVAEPLSLPHLAAHLAGRWTLGTYVLDASSQCSCAVFDADGKNGLACLALLSEELLREGVPTLLESSRRGGHLWVHLVEPTPAQVVRAWLLPYADAFGVEFYPKQDRLASGGPGSLIRLPLGMHQQSRGVGSCPFKEHHYRGDVRSSFQVFGGSDPHWYCYTWRRAGNLFDFLCLYYQLTPHEVWQQLQQGGVW